MSLQVLAAPESRQDPLTCLGLAPCPACARRDRRVVVLAAVVPVLAGLGIALVGSFVFVFVGMLLSAGPDLRQNDERFPWIVACAVNAALLCGGGFAGWQIRAAVRRAAASVTFGPVLSEGEGAPTTGKRLGRPSFFADADQRTRFALGWVAFTALASGMDNFTGLHAPVFVLVAFGVLAGAAAGAVRGNNARERVLFSVAFSVAELGIIVATRAYTAGRTSVWNAELLVPMLLGAIPGALVYLLTAKVLSAQRAAS